MSATATQSPQRQSLFSALRSLADEVKTEKTAGAKPAAGAKRAEELPPDPGGYKGKSTHPSADVDNHGHTLQTGSRASENESDVKEDQGAPGVDSTPEAKHGEGSGDQDSVQLNIGTEQSATGEDPSVEDDYKGDKDDPGTTHPAKTTDGEKYGSLKFADAKKRANVLANDILADLATGFGKELTQSVKVAGKPAPAAKPAKPAANKSAEATPAKPAKPGESTTATLLKQAGEAVRGTGPQAAAQAGYELAAMLGIDKTSASKNVEQCLHETLRDAELDADLVGAYIRQHKQAAARTTAPAKHAADRSDAGAGEDHSKPGDEKPGTGNSAAGGGGESEGDDGHHGGSLGDILGGGGDPGAMLGGDAGGGAGAAPPGAGAPGGDMAGGGAGDMGGGVSKEQALEQLVSALAELGIPIEELAQLGGGAGGGAAGGAGAPPAPPMGAPPGGAAPPPPGGAMPGMGAAPPMGEGMKLASAARSFQRSGKYRFKEATDGTPERELRDEMKNYILDLVKSAEKRHA